MKIKAPAKVNLTLEVLKRRKDGYHEIRSILQTIELYDELEIEESNKPEFFCSRQDLNSEDNLVVKAVRLLQESSGCRKSVRIRLKKNIPVAAGLGGGSSDTAAALRILNTLWELNLSTGELIRLAARLGSDVPYFILGGTALVRGRGEIVKPLPPVVPCWSVLLVPPVETHPDKTARMYRALTESDFTSGEITRSLARRIKAKGEIEDSLLYNVFDEAAQKIYPRLPFFRKILADAAGTDNILLAGSGPCIYMISKHESEASQIWQNLTNKNYKAHVCKTLVTNPPAYWGVR